jgi:EAL domain-containing protein (putative c-di-GMP-specific phosphodiesterase class I)
MLVSADVALYEAKEAGGDQVNTYTASQSATMTWVRRIPAALAEERLVLYGQPIIDLTSGHVVRNELLIRMLSRDGEVIPPGAFLPPAERLGLIGAIDRWVVRAGLRLASEVGGVAINLSGSTIGDQSILAAVREAVAGGLKPDRVMFEITETAATTNLDAARMFTGALNGIGCSVALDDFGTGFGSLTHLKRIPAQYLKIDIEFVRRMTRDATDRQIVASIVGMAAALNKRTIAEGVQDQETLDLLRELGVDYAQGFFIGKPKRLSAPTAFERERDASPPSTPRRSGWRSRPSPGSRGGTPHRVPDPA